MSSLDDPGEVREGFLCPLCLKDLQSFYQLQSHYEDEHSEDRDVKGQIKSKKRGFCSFHSIKETLLNGIDLLGYDAGNNTSKQISSTFLCSVLLVLCVFIYSF